MKKLEYNQLVMQIISALIALIQTYQRVALFVIAMGLNHLTIAQIPPNGDFESGFTGWTLGGTGVAEVLQSGDFSIPANVPEGANMALLATGQNSNAGPNQNIDNNGIDETDIVTLSTTLNFTLSPAVLQFQWSFPSAEEDQPFNFDDVLQVNLDGVAILNGSSNKPGGVSPFPDAPAGPGPAVSVTSGGLTNGNNFRFGIPNFETLCVGIPGTDVSDSFNLEFLTADQGDRAFDSGLLIDAVQVLSACGQGLTQITQTSGSQIEAKNGGLVFTQADNRDTAISDNGSEIAFVSNANLTGDNPNLQEQVFVFAAAMFERISSLVDANINGIDISDNGRYVVFAADNTSDNSEIYRWDRASSSLLTITTTENCTNREPSINDDGLSIAFISDCSGGLATGFNGDANLELVVWNNGSLTVNETLACDNRSPSISRDNTGQYISFESSCDYTGANADANTEIFQFNRSALSFQQITTTPAGQVNASVSSSLTGNFISFVSNADLTGTNADNSLEVFHYTRATNSFIQLTNTDALTFHLNADLDSSGNHVSFERLSAAASTTEIAYYNVSSASETNLSISASAFKPVIALQVGVPLIAFHSNANFVLQNADSNQEIWLGRVE